MPLCVSYINIKQGSHEIGLTYHEIGAEKDEEKMAMNAYLIIVLSYHCARLQVLLTVDSGAVDVFFT